MSEGTDNVSLEFLKKQLEGAEQNRAFLKSSGGGGTFEGMSEVDAKIAAAEARTDTKFAQLMGELRVIEGATRGIKTTVVGTGIAAVALVVAIFTWGSQMFGVGMDAQSIADQAARSVELRTAPQLDTLNSRYQNLEGQVGHIIQLLQADGEVSRSPGQPAPAPSPSPDDGTSPTPFPMPQIEPFQR